MGAITYVSMSQLNNEVDQDRKFEQNLAEMELSSISQETANKQRKEWL